MFLLATQPNSVFGQTLKQYKSNSYHTCKTEIDTLTKQVVYMTADIEAKNEGGKIALMQKFESNINTNINIDLKNFNPKVIVAFIVDKNGSIKGCRIMQDQTNTIGQQMLDIIKSFKWIPGKCHNRNVTMICQVPMTLDPAEE